MKWELLLERTSINRLPRATQRRRLAEIAEAAGRNKTFGFVGRVGKMAEPEKIVDQETRQEVYRYLVRLRLEKISVRSDEVAERQFQHVLGVVMKAAEARKWKVRRDHLPAKCEQGSTQGEPEQVRNEPRPEFVVPDLTPTVFDTFFKGVYEREEHIRTIHSAVQLSMAAGGKIMPHILLYGLPGSCKTVLMERFKAWYESSGEAERVAFVDGTTATKAGLERWILDMAESDCLPEVLVIDEIEKQDKDNLLSLLGIMGSGIVARLNALVGNRRQAARFVVVGLCNDERALREFRDGALWSRFGGNKLPCVRPSKDLCLKILHEMVDSIPGGKPEWADQALAFGWDELGQRDIREIKDHLCGMDRLLTGGWQQDWRTMIADKKREKKMIVEERQRRDRPGMV